MFGPAMTTWLACWTPGLLTASRLHHSALRAGLRGQYAMAELLFDRARARYAEEYEPESMLRLRAQRRVFRALSISPRSTATGA